MADEIAVHGLTQCHEEREHDQQAGELYRRKQHIQACMNKIRPACGSPILDIHFVRQCARRFNAQIDRRRGFERGGQRYRQRMTTEAESRIIRVNAVDRAVVAGRGVGFDLKALGIGDAQYGRPFRGPVLRQSQSIP